MFPRMMRRMISGLAGMGSLLFAQAAMAQVSADVVLRYRPIQGDVDIESPTAAEVPQCKLEVEQVGKGSGWVLYGPQGQILRRFMDTDGDRNVDQFCYYKHGLEVYRDLDTNKNNEVDQSRWFNVAGTRWGIDSNEDKRIDSWKMISAEEASREAVLAMAQGDINRFAAVLVTPEDVKQLGLSSEVALRLNRQAKGAIERFRQIRSETKLLTAKTQWSRFDSSMLMPNLIPAESGKTENDLLVYENVMAIIANGEQNGFVQIGEMVQVGQAWKLTQCPVPLEGDKFELASEGGLLLQPQAASVAAMSEGLSPRMKELLDELRKLDESAPQVNSSSEQIARYNVARAKLLERLVAEAGTPDEKSMWQRQRLEGIAAATQMEAFPNGMDVLQKAEQQLREGGDSELLAFVVFQRMLAEYNLKLRKAEPADQAKVQEEWLQSLQKYVSDFPKSPDAANALLQLARTYEFNGNVADARTWYEKLSSTYGETTAAASARGALRRMDLKGQTLQLSGKSLSGSTLDIASYRGKVVAVIFWATWCKPCTEELPQVQELYRNYQKDGFEIVGVNLDAANAPIQEYIQNYRVSWPHLHEEGALESRLAVEFGVVALPTIFLVDRTGTVVSASASIEDLKTQVPELIKK